MNDLNSVELHFSEAGLMAMNASLAFIMLAVALGMDFRDFELIKKKPLLVLSGLFSQWILLPLMTLGLIYLWNPPGEVALGMILVAVCPGGNVSNFFTYLAGGNTALSVTLTSFSSLLAAFITPIGFSLWSSLSPASSLARSFSISFPELLITLLLIILLPLLLGGLIRRSAPLIAEKLKKPMRWLGIGILGAFIAAAIWNNRAAFMENLGAVFLLVAVHNALAFGGAYGFARIMGMSGRDRTTISIETGIQNSGLALVIIFGFFDGNGAMAVIAAWWGVWHLIAGALFSSFYRKLNEATGDALSSPV